MATNARDDLVQSEQTTTGDSATAVEPEARYVFVNDIAYALADGCTRTFRKRLLRTERVTIHLTSIRGRGAAEDYGTQASNRAAYVLSGTGALRHEHGSADETVVHKGQLIVIPSGAPWGTQLSVQTDELVLLEVAPTNVLHRKTAASEPERQVYVVNPRDVAPYKPAGHEQTLNRCLFADDHMELIEGLIDRGGGAQRHFHRDNEQVLYVLGDIDAPLLIYYPKRTPHGTSGGITEPLALLVIYSPPLGEAHNALT
jgi:mannose-6-phosphate isomerase-like protein (cupin superfamily)